MNRILQTPRHLTLLIGGFAAILVSGIAIAALTMSDRSMADANATAEPGEQSGTPSIPLRGARVNKCAECGIIESTREIAMADDSAGAKNDVQGNAGSRGTVKKKPPVSHEIIIRMQDGSALVINDPYPAQWKQGERVKILSGVN